MKILQHYHPEEKLLCTPRVIRKHMLKEIGYDNIYNYYNNNTLYKKQTNERISTIKLRWDLKSKKSNKIIEKVLEVPYITITTWLDLIIQSKLKEYLLKIEVPIYDFKTRLPFISELLHLQQTKELFGKKVFIRLCSITGDTVEQQPASDKKQLEIIQERISIEIENDEESITSEDSQNINNESESETQDNLTLNTEVCINLYSEGIDIFSQKCNDDFLKELQKFLVLLDIQPEPEQYKIIKEKISKKHGVLLQRGNPWLHLFNFKNYSFYHFKICWVHLLLEGLFKDGLLIVKTLLGKTYIESLSGNLDILIKLYPGVNVPLDPLGNKLNAIEVLDLSMILNIAIELTEYGYFESKIQEFEIEKIQIELDKQTDKRNLTQKEIKDENEKRYTWYHSYTQPTLLSARQFGVFDAFESSITSGNFPILAVGIILITGVTIGKLLCACGMPIWVCSGFTKLSPNPKEKCHPK
ncbi:hypothetical protein M0812_10527 [Anaeramoeba flamelloides]|uniref:Uncharacterized protein n=1 Tax=Anaeramoeba flamelloides TaxID=1746091 RepID=A0AAV7ZXP5_9EUKA|nr:hypothetical protein M0812_10527 [Anaeramoeba flamelloides]